MRNLIAMSLGLGLLAVAACGSSNTQATDCTDTGGLCLKNHAACGDTLPYTCPSGGVCCSPGSQHLTSEAPAPAPR